MSTSRPPKPALERYFYHGDIRAGMEWYSARGDEFRDLFEPVIVKPNDIYRLREQLKRGYVPVRFTRPENAPNVFVGHPWFHIRARLLRRLRQQVHHEPYPLRQGPSVAIQKLLTVERKIEPWLARGAQEGRTCTLH